MIKAIELTNFKGIQDTVRIELRPITLLFGPNSAGKSTIIQALHYAREIFERKNFDPINTETGGKAIDFGGFKSLVNKQDLTKSIILKIEMTTSEMDVEILDAKVEWDPLFDEDNSEQKIRQYDNIVGEIISSANEYSINIEVKWHPKLKRVEATEFIVSLNGEEFLKINESRSTESFIYFKLASINFDHQILKSLITKEEIDSFKNIIAINDNDIDVEIMNLFYVIPDWNKDFQFPDEFILRFKEEGEVGVNALRFLRIMKTVVNNVGLQLMSELKGLRYIGPLREVPPRSFIAHPKAEEDRWANGMAAWDALYNHWVSIKIVNEWLDKLQTGYNVSSKKYFLNNSEINLQLAENLIEKQFEGLKEFTRETQKESLDRFKEFELYHYKENLKLQELIYNGKIEELKNLISIYNENFKEKLTQISDTLASDLSNIPDEINAIGDEIQYGINQLIMSSNKVEDQIIKLTLIEKIKNIHLEPYDIGVGISQVLPVVVASLMKDKNILSIEQPELHIHPAMQVELADLFISEINKGNMIFLLETHSEHIMLRLLKRVREANSTVIPVFQLIPDQLNILYIEQIDGDMFITPLTLDERGRFKNKWPRGFFEERHRELF